MDTDGTENHSTATHGTDHPAAPTQPTLHRHRERQRTERAALDEVLDAALVGHLATVLDGAPLVVPVAYVRDGDRLLLHGSTGAGALRAASGGAPVAFSVAVLDGLVFADSLFSSSMNYRSAVVHGRAAAVPAEDRAAALDVVGAGLMPGRAAEVRGHEARELAATLVLALPLDTFVVKVRTGPPGGEETPGVWCGVLPLTVAAGQPRPAPWVDPALPVARAVESWAGRRGSAGA